MSDNYQAVYDAIRSRFHCDAQAAIESAAREAFGMASHYMASVAQDASIAVTEHGRPCVVFRPKLIQDGNQWCALYGEDLQVGVSGFGDSPAKAMTDFDKNWLTPITTKGTP